MTKELDSIDFLVSSWVPINMNDAQWLKEAKIQSRKDARALIEAEITKAIDAKSKVDNDVFHSLLFGYGEMCENNGLLSREATELRMDLAAYINAHHKTVNELIVEVTKAQERLLDELTINSNVYDDRNYEKEPFYAVLLSEVETKRKELKERK